MSAYDVVPALYEADHSTGSQGRWQWSVLTQKERDRYRRQVTPVLAALRLLPEAARRAYAASLVPPEPEAAHQQHSLLDQPEPDRHAMPPDMLVQVHDEAQRLTATVRDRLVEAGMDPDCADRVTVVFDDSPLLPQPGAPELDLLDHDPTVSP